MAVIVLFLLLPQFPSMNIEVPEAQNAWHSHSRS